ncbi:MAG: RNA-binding protein, partial [Pseudomonadota bacterium]|nr:RNA-binding protein [Pseudomonadota bacterium]
MLASAKQNNRNTEVGRVRHCIVSGAALGPGDGVRFVVGPNGEVVSDVLGKLPGRGLWVRSSAQDISTAIAKGKFVRAARRPVIITDELVEQVERLLTKRCIDLIALARRAGEAVAGYEKVRLRVRGRTDAVVVIACDGADGSREKMKKCADGIPLIECLRAEELGAAFGREKTVHVALDDGGLAEKLQFEAQRLKGFRPYGRNG